MAFYFAEVGQGSAQHALVVHATVFEKSRVFNRQDGIDHDFRDFIDGRESAPFFTKLSNQSPFG